MCLEFGSCFGGGRRDDYGGRSRRRGNNGNGYWSGYWSEPAPEYRQPPIVAVHEAGHKAYYDGASKDEHADAGLVDGGHKVYHDDAPKAAHADAGLVDGGHKVYHDDAPKAAHADAGLVEGGHKVYHDDAPKAEHADAVAGGHKVYHDNAPKAEHADAGSHGGYAYLQDKAGSETPQKPPAWHNKVRDDAGNGAYTPRSHEAAADHREHAAMDYHQYQYPTTTTTLARYQVASR